MNPDKQASNPTACQSQTVSEDEISLVDIVIFLLRRKKLMFSITVIAVCIGTFYAFTQKRVYQVETILLPPSFENIKPLNVLNNSNVASNKVTGNKVTGSAVFARFADNIKSRQVKKAVFDKYKIFKTLSENSSRTLNENDTNNLFEGFSKALDVSVDKNSNSIRITLEGTHKEEIGNWLDSFVEIANQETIDQLVRTLQETIDSRIKSLKVEMSDKQFIYKQQREDELVRLQEAYQIAKSLGIHEHLFIPNNNGKSTRAILAELISISDRLLNVNKLPDYMRGTKVLQAEITALKNRKLDNFHIDGFRDLQKKLTMLEAITIEKNKIQAVIVDKKAAVSINPVRPNRKFIIILSLVLGGLLSIFTVFIIEFICRLRIIIDAESNLDVAKK